MIASTWQLIEIALLACVAASSAAGAAAPTVDFGSRAREAFAAKCAECHSPKLSHPKGKFGYVLDLQRVARNPKLVVRFQPEASKLWTTIEDGDMPPDDASAGDLTEVQKQSIRQWIEAGAPAPLTPAPANLTTRAADDPPRPASLTGRVLRDVGKLHMLFVHFPIALLTAGAMVEAWWILRRRMGISPVVRFCVVFGALGAVAAGVLGWIHASFGGFGTDSGEVLMLHRWLGTAAAIGAVLTALAGEWDAFRCRRSLLFRGVLFTSALLVGAAGHLGGLVVYGSDFFRL